MAFTHNHHGRLGGQSILSKKSLYSTVNIQLISSTAINEKWSVHSRFSIKLLEKINPSAVFFLYFELN